MWLTPCAADHVRYWSNSVMSGSVKIFDNIELHTHCGVPCLKALPGPTHAPTPPQLVRYAANFVYLVTKKLT